MKNGTDVKTWLAAALAWTLAGSVWGQSLAPVNPAFARWQREKAAKGAAQEAETAKPRAARSAAARGEAGGEDMDFGFVPTVLDTGYLSTLNDNLAQGVGDEPPEAYDLREEGALTPVRDQGAYGNCWAFATMGSLESWIKKTEGEELDFSENHLANLHGWSQKFGAGGNEQMAQAYLLRWAGPVAESEDSYPRPENSVPGRVLRHVQRVRWIPGRTGYLDNDGIKAALRTYGALQASYYHSSGYYNAKAASYYFDAGASFRLENHAVDLVGWDDNYSRKNFKRQPPGDGAFIVRNSWGSGWGDGGYFHVSYYDESFAWSPLYSFSSAEPADNYDAIYQYDPLGLVGSVGYNGPTAWGANLFTAGEASKVAAVGFYAMTPRTTYKLFVYTGCRAGEPRSGALAAQQSGTVDLAGFATVPLETPAAVAAGQRFSVVLELTTPGYAYPLAAEYAVAGYSGAATAHEGESFLSANGTAWHDFTKRVGSTANFCCKAYVKGAVAEKTLAGIAIAGVNSLKAGSSAAFTCTASYSDGSAKAVSPSWRIAEGGDWADVSGDGTVTAKAVEEERTVTVEASYTEGDVTKTATWAFRVTVAPPAAPTGLTATEGTEDSCVRLSWTASAGASGYSVYRGKREGASHAAYLGNVTAPRYADTTAEPGRDYRYFVKAKNGSGSSAFGEGAWGWRALAAPTGVTASDGSKEDVVELVWNRSEGASHYQVWRVEADQAAEAGPVPVSEWLAACQWADATTAAGVVYAYSVTAALDADGTRASAASLPDDGFRTGPKALAAIEIAGPVSLASGARGSYFCTAVYNDGSRVPASPEWTLDSGTLEVGDGFAAVTAPPASENTGIVLGAAFADGEESRTASLSITVVPVIPAAPEGLELVSESEDGIALRWNAVADASGYQVWRAAADGEPSVVASTTETGCVDAGAVPGVAYVYRVGSVNAAGAGEPGAASVAAMRPIAAPGGVAASYGLFTDKVAVSWNACEGAAFYRVWRAESADGERTAIGEWQEELAFDDTDATPGTAYYYSVQAAADAEGTAAGAFGGPAVGLRKTSPKPILLTIAGPARVTAESTAAYTAKVRYNNDTVQTVVPVWSLLSGDAHAAIGADGLLTVGALEEDQSIDIGAEFTDGGTTLSATLAVTLVAPVVKSAAVSAIEAHARWPWNGWVDVDYILDTAPEGTLAKVTLSGYDLDHKTALAANTLAGDGAAGATVEAGKRRISWNLGADYPDFHASRISVLLTAVPSDPEEDVEPDELDLREGGLDVAFHDLNSSEWPYSTWRSSYDDMLTFFEATPTSLATNTVYLGETFDFGYTPWYGTCLFPGKYGNASAEDFAALFSGYIEIPEDGIYQFLTWSDDGVVLYIDRQLVFSAFDSQDRSYEYGGETTLTAGLHEIAIAYHERGERQGMRMYWKGPGAAKRTLLPQSVLRYSGDGGGDEGGDDNPPEPEPEPEPEHSTGLMEGLVAYWPFDGDAKDASGNGNHGIVNGATLIADRNGNANGAYHFNGRGNIRIPDSASLRSPTNAISFVFWMKAGREILTTTICCKGGGSRQYGLFINSENNIGSYYVNDWCGVNGVDVICHETPAIPLVGQWQHVAVTWDGKTIKVYMDGVKVGEEQATGVFATNTADLLIGEDPPGATEYLLGDLDDLAIWNRALTADEVARLHAGDSPLDNGRYLVVDLSGGPTAESWPVEFLSDVPAGGFNKDEYKTQKLVLRLIEAGNFMMGSPSDELGRFSNEDQHPVTLTKPYYIGLFELTQRQWELAMGRNPSTNTGEMRPVENVSYDDIRGSGAGAGWPASSAVDPGSFIGVLRAKTGLKFDLPTDAQWEYACRAGTATALYSGLNLTNRNHDAAVDEIARYGYDNGTFGDFQDGKGGYPTKHTTVGSYLPNAWGLYDMNGNMWEWALDWYAFSLGTGGVTNPVGRTSGSERVRRGGAWDNSAWHCRSASRDHFGPSDASIHNSFRVACDYRQTQTVDFPAIGKQTVSGRVELSAKATSGGEIVFAVVSGPGVLDGNILTFTGTGTVEVSATQAGDEIWEPATAIQRVVVDEDDETDPLAGLSRGLVAYWPFDGDAKDASGNGNDGKVNGATPAADRNGKAGGAYWFDGTSTIAVPDSASLRSVTAAFTIATWVKYDQLDTEWITILSQGDDGGCHLRFNINALHPRETDIGYVVHATFNTIPEQGEWAHVAVTFDENWVATAYVNGKPVGTQQNSYRLMSRNAALLIGTDPPGACEYLHGALDDLAIWNRALTAEEVARLYAGRVPAQRNLADGLVAYWPFDGDAKDASGNGNDGTVNGATLAVDRNGNANGAYHFNGNGNIQIPDSASLRSPTNAISFVFWMKPGREILTTTICCKGDGSRQYGLFINSENNIGSYYVNDWCGVNGVDVICHETPAIPLVGQWQHVAVTWDGKTIKVYMDGVKVGEETASGVFATNTADLLIGEDPPGVTEYLLGDLDELAIWNRALSADEIMQLYTGANPVASNSIALLHRWSFNGDLTDSIMGQTGVYSGSSACAWRADGKAISLEGGAYGNSAVLLGRDTVPTDNTPFTLEIWATQREARRQARIFEVVTRMGQNYNSDTLGMSWSYDEDVTRAEIWAWKAGVDRYHLDTVASYWEVPGIAPFSLGVEYHISVVVEPNKLGDGRTFLRFTKRDTTTGNILAQTSGFVRDDWVPSMLAGGELWLGRSTFSNDLDAAADYDEVRVWNTAVTAEHLSESARVGPDALPNWVAEREGVAPAPGVTRK